MKIDIIVPYVDENDESWQQDFNHYKEQEIKQGLQSSSNKQAFAEERIRDWDTFRYWFRGVEKNCSWVNKVFLVVQRESQLPKWLNRNNPKLRVVYHDEFIPKELLPTFSTLVIETFYYRILDLSEHFIVSNDDFFFLNKIPKDLFFKDDKIIQGLKGYRKKDWTCGNRDWESIVHNNDSFLEKYVIQKPVNEVYHYSHLPDGRVKSFETNFMSKYYNEIYNAMRVSRFRHPKNLIPSLLFIDTMKYTNYGTLSDRVYKNSRYVTVTCDTNFNEYKDCEMVCFNDTAAIGDRFATCKRNMLSFLRMMLPSMSSFELEEEVQQTKPIFGIISWFPNDEVQRNQRIDRFIKMLTQMHTLFDKIPFMIVAQNWKDFELPSFVNAKVFKYDKLGILGARKTLGKHFLESSYDYLIMLDDDVVLETSEQFSQDYFLDELNQHPNGFVFLKYGWSLTFCAISKYIYEQCPMIDIDPEKNEGYEDTIWPYLLHYKFPNYEFSLTGIKFVQHQQEYHKDHKSTWDNNKIDHGLMGKITHFYVERFKKGIFTIDKKLSREYFDKLKWIDNALYYGWIQKEEVPKMLEKYFK